jgi:aminoglycoside phosphotransferase (APT) family kinase protein
MPRLETHGDGVSSPLRMSQFKGGESNPTYRLETPAASLVWRRKPSGATVPGAHAIDGEGRVIQALAQTDFPVHRRPAP